MSSEPRPAPNGRLFWSTVAAVLALDVVTKALVQKHLPVATPQPVIGDVVRFTLVYNRGAAFSMSLGSNSRYLFGAFAIVAIVILWRLYRQSRATEGTRVLALALATGGAMGNLVDRVREPRGVVDFIDIGVGHVRFWTFNVADSAVTIGALLLAWVLWTEDRAAHGRRAESRDHAKTKRAEVPERTSP